MDFFSRLAALLMSLVDKYDAPALALVILLDESGLPSPVPGDLLMMMAGYRISQNEMSLVLTLVLLELATVCGTSVNYWLGARGGRALLERYRRHLPVSPQRFEQLEGWLARHGFMAIVVARVIPLLRGWTPMLSGTLGVPYRTFVLAIATGGFLYMCLLLTAGWLLGPYAVRAFGGLRITVRATATVVMFIGLTVLLIYLNKRRAARQKLVPIPLAHRRGVLETSVLAGVLATIQMAVGVNSALFLLSTFSVLRPERALLQLVLVASERLGGGTLVGAITFVVALMFFLHAIWAVIYAELAVNYLPGPVWFKGLVFSVLPLAVSAFVVLPVLGAGFLGLRLEDGLLPLLGEVFRNAVFGISLGISYALLRDALAPPSATPTGGGLPGTSATGAPGMDAVSPTQAGVRLGEVSRPG